MNLYGLFILDVNIKYIVFSILYRHVNVPVACKELKRIFQLFLSNLVSHLEDTWKDDH